MKKAFSIIVIMINVFGIAIGQSQSQKDYETGLAYEEVKQYANAIYYFEKAWSSRKTSTYANHISNCYFELRDFNLAYEWLKKELKRKKKIENKELLFEVLISNSKYDLIKKYLINEFVQDSAEIWYKQISQEIDSSQVWIKHPEGRVRNLEMINTPYSEISPSMYESGLVFSSNRENAIIKKKDGKTGLAYFNIYISLGAKKSFSEPKTFSTTLNSTGHDMAISFSYDFQDIYFSRIESTQRSNVNNSNRNRMKIYRSQKENDVWNKPTKFLMNDSLSSFGQPFISSDGELFFFASNMPGGYGGTDLYVCKKLDSTHWTVPINLGPEINTSENEMNPFYDEDNKELFFSSNGHFSMGGYDLYSSKLLGRKWEDAQNLKYPINSSGDDFSIYWIDKKSAYICSNRKGTRGLEDIFFFYK